MKKVIVNEEKKVITALLGKRRTPFVGIARCNETAGDQFDELKGVDLAMKRAMLSKAKFRRLELQKKRASMLKQIEELDRVIETREIQINELNADIKSILDSCQ